MSEECQTARTSPADIRDMMAIARFFLTVGRAIDQRAAVSLPREIVARTSGNAEAAGI
jgi:hypothetical protein